MAAGDEYLSNGIAEEEVVLITGFGPFSVHRTNASWEVVKELSNFPKNGYKLITEEINVSYETVDSRVPDLWRKFKPKLTVHCGVSGVAKYLTLEQKGRKNGYRSEDVNGCIPKSFSCCREGPDSICSKLNMDLVCQKINESKCGVTSVVSNDAGRYLCDYTFYTSLTIDPSRSAFIHVPVLDKPYSVKQLASAIHIAILEMLRQLDKNADCDYSSVQQEVTEPVITNS